MSKLKHTPGPWEYDGKKSVVPCNGEFDIADVWNCGRREIQTRANARLIAAAPEMLEALITEAKNQVIRIGVAKNIDEFILHIGKTKIMQLIEKATGLTIDEVLKCTE